MEDFNNTHPHMSNVCMITWSIYHIHIACSKQSLDNQQGAMLQASPTALLAAWSASSCLGCTSMPSPRWSMFKQENLDVSGIVTTIVGGFSPTHLKKYARQSNWIISPGFGGEHKNDWKQHLEQTTMKTSNVAEIYTDSSSQDILQTVGHDGKAIRFA